MGRRWLGLLGLALWDCRWLGLPAAGQPRTIEFGGTIHKLLRSQLVLVQRLIRRWWRCRWRRPRAQWRWRRPSAQGCARRGLRRQRHALLHVLDAGADDRSLEGLVLVQVVCVQQLIRRWWPRRRRKPRAQWRWRRPRAQGCARRGLKRLRHGNLNSVLQVLDAGADDRSLEGLVQLVFVQRLIRRWWRCRWRKPRPQWRWRRPRAQGSARRHGGDLLNCQLSDLLFRPSSDRGHDGRCGGWPLTDMDWI